MNRKAKAAEAPQVPKAFAERLSGIHDVSARDQAVKILGGLGVDDSGHRKTVALLVPVAWALHVKGGGASRDRVRLDELRYRRAQSIGRLGGLTAKGLPVAEVEGEIAAIGREIERLEALSEAAGDLSDDQLARKARRDRAVSALTTLQIRIAPYRAARLRGPEVEALEREEFAAEREATAAEAAFQEGGEELRRIGTQGEGLKRQALAALAAACETGAERLGAQAADVVRPDAEFLRARPGRLPAVCDAFFRRATELDHLADQLGGGAGRGVRGFLTGAGDVGDVFAAAFGISFRKKSEDGPRLPALEVAASVLDRELGGMVS